MCFSRLGSIYNLFTFDGTFCRIKPSLKWNFAFCSLTRNQWHFPKSNFARTVLTVLQYNRWEFTLKYKKTAGPQLQTGGVGNDILEEIFRPDPALRSPPDPAHSGVDKSSLWSCSSYYRILRERNKLWDVAISVVELLRGENFQHSRTAWDHPQISLWLVTTVLLAATAWDIGRPWSSGWHSMFLWWCRESC